MDAKTRKKIELLRNLIDHPRTGDNERQAARLTLARVIAKAKERGESMPEDSKGGAWVDRRTYGAKYDSQLTTTQIAAIVRAQIKLARKLAKQTASEKGALKLPDPIGDAPAELTFSVRSEYFSGGSAIDITIKGIPEDWGWTMKPDPYRPGEEQRRPSDALQALADELSGLMKPYNYDGSDPYADYFDVNFYGHVYAEGGLVLAV